MGLAETIEARVFLVEIEIGLGFLGGLFVDEVGLGLGFDGLLWGVVVEEVVGCLGVEMDVGIWVLFGLVVVGRRRRWGEVDGFEAVEERGRSGDGGVIV